jgi:hypothetical protein
MKNSPAALKVPKMNCQARVLNTAYTIPNTKLIYHTTTECGGEISKKLSVDSGDAYMNICSCCFRRYNAKGKPDWYGWFDGSYPPEAKVVGSKWYHEAMAAAREQPDEDIDLPIENLRISEAEPEAEEEAEAEAEEAEAEAEAEVEAEAEAEEAEAQEEPKPQETKEEKKEALKARIKQLQLNAKPGKMSLKEIQAAFKEITNLKTQIHML